MHSVTVGNFNIAFIESLRFYLVLMDDIGKHKDFIKAENSG